MTFEEFIATQILNLRLGHAWTQRRLAAKAGLHVQAVVGLEEGRRPPRLETLEMIAHALGISLPALFEGAPVPPPPSRPGRMARPRSRQSPEAFTLRESKNLMRIIERIVRELPQDPQS